MWPFGKRRRHTGDAAAGRPPLAGVVTVGGREWHVREEKRSQGEVAQQLLILNASDGGGAEMHIRSLPGREATALEDVEALALHPTTRWFDDASGARWEARLVQSDAPPGKLVKFVSWAEGVHEAPDPFPQGLGSVSDEDLRATLEALRARRR